ncbi:MAG: hypothetical protein AB7V43_14980, partial [Acidimicrobiia bacterium]
TPKGSSVAASVALAIDHLVEFLGRHLFDELLDLTVVPAVIWIVARVGTPTVLTDERAEVRLELPSVPRHPRHGGRPTSATPADIGRSRLFSL